MNRYKQNLRLSNVVFLMGAVMLFALVEAFVSSFGNIPCMALTAIASWIHCAALSSVLNGFKKERERLKKERNDIDKNDKESVQ